jgi:hypothetical protein
MNLCFDLHGIVRTCFRSFDFKQLDHILIGAECSVRNVFSLRDAPMGCVVDGESGERQCLEADHGRAAPAVQQQRCITPCTTHARAGAAAARTCGRSGLRVCGGWSTLRNTGLRKRTDGGELTCRAVVSARGDRFCARRRTSVSRWPCRSLCRPSPWPARRSVTLSRCGRRAADRRSAATTSCGMPTASTSTACSPKRTGRRDTRAATIARRRSRYWTPVPASSSSRCSTPGR